MTGLDVSPDLALPLEAVTETVAILAVRRAGKTNAAVSMAEEMTRHGLPWVALDPVGSWWGIRYAGDGGPGLSVLVLGGQHGDLPLQPGSGHLVADLIIDNNLTCVLDLSQMDDEEELPQFATAFLRRLFERNTDPRHVFFEEADVILPQVPARKALPMLRAGTKLIKLGGGRGIGCTLITQRSASLNKNALAQISTLVALRTTWPPDQDAITHWMKSHSTSADIAAELPDLADGEAFIFSPQWLGPLTRIRFRRRHTYDSGATPKIGQTVRPPTDLASIDIGALREAMAATLEHAAADDPDQLRAQISTLRAELAARGGPAPAPKPVYVSVVTEADVEDLTKRLAWLRDSLTPQVRDQLAQVEDAVRTVAEVLAEIASRRTPPAPEEPTPTATPAPAATARRHRSTPAPAQPPPADGAAPTKLRPGAHRMVVALGRMYPRRLTKSQWGTVAKLKPSGGTWSAYMTDIRRAGYLEEDTAGSGYTLTAAGFDYLGGRPEPMTAQELQEHYRQSLPRGAAAMLDALIGSYPSGLTKEQLGAAAGLAGRGGTFTGYVADLIRNGLAERTGDIITATSVLVHGADAGQ